MARIFAASMLALGALLASEASVAGPPARRPAAVLVMVPGLTWRTAPRELGSFAKANLALRSASKGQTEIDGYLSIGKGRRSGGLGNDFGAGRAERDGQGLRLADWGRFVRHDASLGYGGRLGSLGQALRDAGTSWALVRDDPRAAVAAADRRGTVPRAAAGGRGTVRAMLATGVRSLIVEAPPAALPAVLDTATHACVLVASSSSPDDALHLGVFAASPDCRLGRGALASPSTRQRGFVTLPDVAPTFLAASGVAVPSAMNGGPAHRAGGIDVATLIAEDRRAGVALGSQKPLAHLYLWLNVVGALVAVTVRRARYAIACALLAVPPASLLMMLTPWWKWGTAGAIIVGGSIAAALAIAATAVARRDAGKALAALAGLGALVVGLNAVVGGTLELDAPFANTALGAGRFAGVGNVPFGFLAAGLIVACAIALDRFGGAARRWVVVALVAAVVLDGAPPFGADVGGVLAGVPAYVVLWSLSRAARGRGRNLVPVGLAVATAAVVLAAFAAFDLARAPTAQTHLARSLSRGDLGDTLHRKAHSAVRSVRTSRIGPIAVIGLLALAAARPAVPRRALRAGAYALAVLAVLGTALNDSGVSVAAAVVAVAWPSYLALDEAGAKRRPMGSVEARSLATAR